MAKEDSPHPGIAINRIRFGSGIMGLVFTVGCMLLFLTGVPLLWYPFIGAVILGAGSATALHLLRH